MSGYVLTMCKLNVNSKSNGSGCPLPENGNAAKGEAVGEAYPPTVRDFNPTLLLAAFNSFQSDSPDGESKTKGRYGMVEFDSLAELGNRLREATSAGVDQQAVCDLFDRLDIDEEELDEFAEAWAAEAAHGPAAIEALGAAFKTGVLFGAMSERESTGGAVV